MMELDMDRQLIQGIWGYHWWGNRQHFDDVAALGEEAAKKEIGKQFSFPTLKGMLAHIYGADRIWFERWKGASPARLQGDGDFASLADLRNHWDALEAEQKAFVTALGTADLKRQLDYTSTDGKPFSQPLWQLLQHVVNHATHHRSEIATMVTMVKGSPKSTDMVFYYRQPRP
jgi:uncharacterized damage-inducible protein DinB